MADRVGHRRVLVAGYVLGASAASLVAVAFLRESRSVPMLTLVFVLAGLYVAIQDALEPAMRADLVDPEIRGMSYGVLGTVNGVGDFVSSAMVGFLWTAWSPMAGFGLAAAMMAIGTVAMLCVRA